MSYLNKSERKNLILEVAKSIALEDGLSTLTVRRIADAASLSVGLIHHHFASIQELKSEVFIQLAYQNLDMSHLAEPSTWEEKLLDMLGFVNTTEELPYIRLWNDAEQISQNNTEFAKVYWAAIEVWHSHIVKLLRLIKFRSEQEKLNEIAWQLIGMTLGFERLSQFNNAVFSLEYMSDLILALVNSKI